MNKPLSVWILQTGEPLHIDGESARPMRGMNLANILAEKGHDVTIWSSAFYHQKKMHRCTDYKVFKVSDNISIRLIPSPGYMKHIGLARLYDHLVLALNLRKILKSETTKPNVAFLGFPPIEVVYFMGRWLKKNDVPYILDVKDQWPDIFIKGLPGILKFIGRVALFPYFYMAKKAMKSAAGLTSMAEGFLNWSLSFSGRMKTEMDKVVPLTVSNVRVSDVERKEAFSWLKKQGIASNKPRVVFIGTHSTAFDMSPVFKAAQFFNDNEIDCEFVICGDGPCKSEWEKESSHLSNVIFPGWVDKPKIEVLMDSSIAILAPYFNTENFIINLPNKIIDGLSFGLPILSPLKGEVQSLIQNNSAGFHYSETFGDTLEHHLKILIDDTSLLQNYKNNAKTLYNEKFAFEKVYGDLVAHLAHLARKENNDIRT